MKEYYITNNQDGPNVNLSDVIGKIEFYHTPIAKVYTEILMSEHGPKMRIVPRGIGNKDENGNITSFDPISFSIVMEQ